MISFTEIDWSPFLIPKSPNLSTSGDLGIDIHDNERKKSKRKNKIGRSSNKNRRIPSSKKRSTTDDDDNGGDQRKRRKMIKTTKVPGDEESHNYLTRSTENDVVLQFSDLNPIQQDHYRKYQRYFRRNPIIDTWIKPMVAKKDCTGIHSGRLLEYFLKNYIKENSVRYYLWFEDYIHNDESGEKCDEYDEDGDMPYIHKLPPSRFFETLDDLQAHVVNTGKKLTPFNWMQFDLLSEYRIMIHSFHQLEFDLFRRGPKLLFCYEKPDGAQSTIETTFCQLFFFMWASGCQLQSYWCKYHEQVRSYLYSSKSGSGRTCRVTAKNTKIDGNTTEKPKRTTRKKTISLQSHSYTLNSSALDGEKEEEQIPPSSPVMNDGNEIITLYRDKLDRKKGVRHPYRHWQQYSIFAASDVII